MRKINNFAYVEYNELTSLWYAYGQTKNGKYLLGEFQYWKQAADRRREFERDNNLPQQSFQPQSHRLLDRSWKPSAHDKAAYVALFREDMLNPTVHMNQIAQNHKAKGEGTLKEVYRESPKMRETIHIATQWQKRVPLYYAEDIKAVLGHRIPISQWCRQRRVPRIMPVEDAAYELARNGHTDIFDPKVPSNFAYQKLIESAQRKTVKTWDLLDNVVHDQEKGMSTWRARCRTCGHEDIVVVQRLKACPVCSAPKAVLPNVIRLWLTPSGVQWKRVKPDDAIAYFTIKGEDQEPLYYSLKDEPLDTEAVKMLFTAPEAVLLQMQEDEQTNPEVSEETGTTAPSTKMDISDLPFD